MDDQSNKFGAYVRRAREAREIGLREMAKMIGVSPTYLFEGRAGQSFHRPSRTK